MAPVGLPWGSLSKPASLVAHGALLCLEGIYRDQGHVYKAIAVFEQARAAGSPGALLALGTIYR